MIKHSPRHKSLLRDRRGFSTLVATIFMVLVFLFLIFNVFMFMLERNTALEDTTSLARQMSVDRITEQLSVFGLNYSVDGASHVSVSFAVNNVSPLSIEIVSVWIKDLTLPPTQTNYGCNSTAVVLPIVLQPGEREYVPLNTVSVTINGASSSDSFVSWFVTRRGRAISTITSVTYVPGVLAGFVFSTIGNHKVGAVFSITITAVDAYGSTVKSYTGTNTLRDVTGTMTPVSTGSFVNGVWIGQVMVNQAWTGDVIFTQGGGSTGISNPFDITTAGVPFDKDGYSAAHADSGSISIPSFNTTYRNDIIYLVVVSSSYVLSVTTPPWNNLTWTQRSSVAFSSNYRLETWYAIMSSSGQVGTITVSFPNLINYAAAVAFGISGADTTSPFDPRIAPPTAPPNATGNGKVANVNITTSNANDLIIGALGIYSTTGFPTLLQGVGFTPITTQSSSFALTSAEYRVVSAPQTGLSVGYDWSTSFYSNNWVMIADAVEAAS